MQFSFQYNVSEANYVRGLRAVATSILAHDRKRGWSIALELAILILVVAILWVAFPYSLDAIVFTVTLTVACFCILRGLLARRWWRITYDPGRSDVVLAISEKGVTVSQGHAERRYSWNGVRRIHDLPEAVILETTDWHPIPMPAELWAGPEERSAFLAELRAAATDLEADRTPPAFGRSLLLRLLGAIAIAFQAMIMTDEWIASAFLHGCSPTFRYSRLGQLLGVAPLAAYVATMAVAWLALKWLNHRWPRLATSFAVASVVLFVATQALPPMFQIFHFFSSVPS